MAYYLRTTDKDGRAHGGFEWPRVVGAEVVAPDWKPEATCGNGLHGLLDGLGIPSLLNFRIDALWWIVEADDAIDLHGKHKFPRCKIVAFGPRHEVTPQLYALRPGPIHGLMLTGGDWSTLTGGEWSTLTGGYWSTLTGGYWSRLTGGHMSVLTGGDWSTLTGGDRSTLTGGDWSTLTGGDESRLTGGHMSVLTGGHGSVLTGGHRSVLLFLSFINGVRRVLTVYVGENGILPNVKYRASDDHMTAVAA